MNNMIYTVTFNPSLDYVITVQNFSRGTINRTQKELLFPGGKGLNVSMVLKNLGVENTALGFLAGFTGEQIKTLLEEKGVTADFIKIEDGLSRINVKLSSVQGEVREETEINGQGPVIAASDIEKLYEMLGKLKEGDILVLAGSIPASMPSTVYRDIMEYLSGRKIKIVVDASKDLLGNVVPYQPFLIKPNHHELGELFGAEITEKEEAIFYAKKLKEQGAENVLVSMAGEGAVLVAEDGSVYQMNAPVGVVKNSVGAGDSMVAGFLAGYLNGGNYETAFHMGVCAGSASAFSDGLATEQDVLALIKTIK